MSASVSAMLTMGKVGATFLNALAALGSLPTSTSGYNAVNSRASGSSLPTSPAA
jgi:hypothetical protein